MSVEKTVWKLIMDKLIESGIEAYPPATKVGECKKPYVVVKQAGSAKILNYSSQRDFYDFYCYVPKNAYSTLTNFEARVKSVLDIPPLYPMIMPTGNTENDYYDDNIDAHMRRFTYYNNKRVQHL